MDPLGEVYTLGLQPSQKVDLSTPTPVHLLRRWARSLPSLQGRQHLGARAGQHFTASLAEGTVSESRAVSRLSSFALSNEHVACCFWSGAVFCCSTCMICLADADLEVLGESDAGRGFKDNLFQDFPRLSQRALRRRSKQRCGGLTRQVPPKKSKQDIYLHCWSIESVSNWVYMG